MKNFFVFISCILLCSLSDGQSMSWIWARNAGGAGYQEGAAVASDAGNNVFVTGFFHSDIIILGTDTLYNMGSQNMFIAKYSPSGNVLWAKSADVRGRDSVAGNSIATDAGGNVYVTGYYMGYAVIFDGVILYGALNGNLNFYMVKYDGSGNLLWAKSWPGAGYSTGAGITTDAGGRVYVTGYFGGDSISFGNIALTNSDFTAQSVFVAKFDASGNALWAQTPAAMFGPGQAQGQAITCDQSGNVYVTGWYNKVVLTFGSTALPSPNIQNVFTVKMDSSGNSLWANYGSGAMGFSYGIAVDARSNVYITGGFSYGPIVFGSDTVRVDRRGLIMPFGDGFFVVKYNALGAGVWAKGETGAPMAYGICLATDADGQHVYLAGGFYGDSITIDSTTLLWPSANPDALFIVEFDSTDHIICSSVLAAGGSDLFGICINRAGDGYLGSDFYVKDFVVGSDSLHNAAVNSENVYVAKFSCPHCTAQANITSAQSTICPGDSTQLCAPAGYSGYYWNNGDTGVCIHAAAAGNYYVTVSDNGNCSAESNHVFIDVYAPVTVIINVKGDTLTGYNTGGSQWFLNGALIPGATSPVYIASTFGSYTLQITDSNGCLTSSTPIVISGIEGTLTQNNITIFPNPATDNAIINFGFTAGKDGEAGLIINNALGQTIYKQQLTASGGYQKIDVSEFAAGLYNVAIVRNGGIVWAGKFVKE